MTGLVLLTEEAAHTLSDSHVLAVFFAAQHRDFGLGEPTWLCPVH